MLQPEGKDLQCILTNNLIQDKRTARSLFAIGQLTKHLPFNAKLTSQKSRFFFIGNKFLSSNRELSSLNQISKKVHNFKLKQQKSPLYPSIHKVLSR